MFEIAVMWPDVPACHAIVRTIVKHDDLITSLCYMQCIEAICFFNPGSYEGSTIIMFLTTSGSHQHEKKDVRQQFHAKHFNGDRKLHQTVA